MVKVIWTNRALIDLEEIANYISKDSFHYAKLTLSKLIDSEINISNNPKIGRVVPEIDNENVREIIKGSYRIIYEIRKNNSIYILTVFHSARFFKESDIS